MQARDPEENLGEIFSLLARLARENPALPLWVLLVEPAKLSRSEPTVRV